MGETRIELRIASGTAWITLDGPATRNALDTQAAGDLVAACAQIDADPGVGAAIITGAGQAFCSGADTRVIAGLRGARPDEAYDGLEIVYGAFRRVGQLGVPTVAAINGAAVGAGLNLALASDLRLVASGAVLVSGFAAIGLHPGGGHLHLLARAGGTGIAAAAGVFAHPITADRAVTSGLAWAAVPAADLVPAAERRRHPSGGRPAAGPSPRGHAAAHGHRPNRVGPFGRDRTRPPDVVAVPSPHGESDVPDVADRPGEGRVDQGNRRRARVRSASSTAPNSTPPTAPTSSRASCSASWAVAAISGPLVPAEYGGLGRRRPRVRR